MRKKVNNPGTKFHVAIPNEFELMGFFKTIFMSSRKFHFANKAMKLGHMEMLNNEIRIAHRGQQVPTYLKNDPDIGVYVQRINQLTDEPSIMVLDLEKSKVEVDGEYEIPGQFPAWLTVEIAAIAAATALSH